MSDRMNDVLAAIDAELNKCICGEPLQPNGPSFDYCSEDCQGNWFERLGAPDEDPGPLSDSIADNLARVAEAGREVVNALSEAFAPLGEAVRSAAELMRRLDTLVAIVPDETERNNYWESAGGDLDRAISLAQLGIPHDLAREHPEMPVEELARLAHCREPGPAEPQTSAGQRAGAMRPIPRLNIRIVHDRPSDARSTT